MTVIIVGSGGVPAGSYTGTFSGIEPAPEDKERGYAAGTRWKFTISTGPYAGRMIGRITRDTPNPNNVGGKILAGLVGRPLKEGEPIDVSAFIGKPYMLVYGPGPKGGMRVEAVLPLPPQ
jgi:hypothetical protein